MALFGRQDTDDVDVESCLENLDRVDDFVARPRGQVIDLRRTDDTDPTQPDGPVYEPRHARSRPLRITSGRGAAASSGRTRPG